VKVWSALSTPTPDFEYYPMRFFEENCFPLEADHFHPIKRVANFVVSLAVQGNQKSVGAELDVVAHHGRVHPNEFDREGIEDKFHFNVNCTADNFHLFCN
jgi:hypothetical protein